MKYTKENIAEGISAKLDEIFGENPTTATSANVFKKILPNYPKEIEQNVLEWVNGEELSEIDCHGISVKELVDELSLVDCQMPQLFKNFIDFEKCGFVGSAICYRYL